MQSAPSISLAAFACATAVSGCDMQNTPGDRPFAPEYLGVETRLLDEDLVNFRVEMTGARDRADLARYAECAAAKYALIRGHGFARHLRTTMVEGGRSGIWRADAIYTISAALPEGLKTIDAEIVAADCAENEIPMV